MRASLLFLLAFLFPSIGLGRGTHFIIEARPGLLAHHGYAGEEWASGAEAALGAGLRVPATPLRIYVLGTAGFYTSSTDVGSIDGASVLERRIVRLGIGPRFMLPVAGRMRAFVDLGWARAIVDSTALRNGLERYDTERVGNGVLLGAGLQYRFSERFSLGAAYSRSIEVDSSGFDFAAAAAGLGRSGEAPGQSVLALTAGVHF